MATTSPKEKLPDFLFPNPPQHEHDSLYLSRSENTTTTVEEKCQHGNEADNQDEGIEMQLLRLARTLSGPSGPNNDVMFPYETRSNLDPNSPTFNPRKWARAFVRAKTAASDGIKPRTAGLAFKDLSVYGFGTATDYQKTVGNAALGAVSRIRGLFSDKKQRVDILQDLEGLVEQGEMLCVLGPPGSGCSTLLKTIAGDTNGFHVGQGSTLNYQGIRPEQMKTMYRGESIYTAEVDDHFPHLTVGDALYFAAVCRCPRIVPDGMTREKYAEHLRDVIMAMFGISHTKNTKVGNDFVRGVSGGERKRVTIAEAALSYAPMQCWDNSTRGLDSANAIEFCRTLRTQSDILGLTSCVAIYQAPQAAYDLFDKVIVLYEGRQIFFGKVKEARAYFEQLGFNCTEQQTTADFLTSMTNRTERVVRPGWEDKVPRTADEFAQAWRASQQRSSLIDKIDSYIDQHPFDGEHNQVFFQSRRADQSLKQREQSPYNLSYWRQISVTLWRNWTLLKGDPSVTLTMLGANLFEALVVSSIFYNLPQDTSSFYRRTVLLFFVILLNAFSSMLEIMSLYAKRKIVEKHARYAFYRPSTEAISAMIIDLPYKIVNAVLTNLVLYFMGHLRREPGPFFFFLLITFTLTPAMSMVFRFIGSITRSIEQALAPAAVVLLGLVIYTGFVIPPSYMQDWLGWLRWLNPVYYGLESAYLNEFVGRQFPCAQFVPSGPGYDSASSASRGCNSIGSVPGQSLVDGGAYLEASFGFVNSHRWRNFGILIGLMITFTVLHLVASEYVTSQRSKGEVLVFTREAIKKRTVHQITDIETASSPAATLQQASDREPDENVGIQRQTASFHWNNVCYDIEIKGEDRRILDHVDGWVKPGTLTALMGVSGAGKTTLLDVLASRVTMGVVNGDMLVDGNPRDCSFQRKTGYVQQQDLHLATSTVREALNFSALLRQPSSYTKEEKLAYVDKVIDLLSMESFSDAIIGTPGEGLNVEQRKRLTIGVELAARPQLLLFLDEPTSGLDSQTSWSICNLLRKLTDAGQAVLCTIHQPSAMLFQRFDRLLLLAKGGKTVYFGEIGRNSHILMDYFARNGGPSLPPGVNPAEHMLAVIGAAPGASTDIDWPAVWRQSPEYRAVQAELTALASNGTSTKHNEGSTSDPSEASEHEEYATPWSVQLDQVTKRTFQLFWRSPKYIYSKALLSAGTALFIGLSILNNDNTIRGLQNQMFGVFIFLASFAQLIQQIFPVFVDQRMLYEVRERPSKSYSWQSFMLANIAVEIVWNSLMSVLCFICWYFPIGVYRNAEWTDQVDSRGITAFLYIWVLFLFVSTFAHMIIAGLPNPDIGGAVLNVFFVMIFSFCGVLAGPKTLPGFWIFMYRVNPFTYVVEGLLGTTLANAPVTCAANELITFPPPNGSTCAKYLADYISVAGGYLAKGSAGSTDKCHYCRMSSTNEFLASVNTDFANRWRDFGFLWAYIVFNIAAAMLLYWLVRIPKGRKVKKE